MSKWQTRTHGSHRQVGKRFRASSGSARGAKHSQPYRPREMTFDELIEQRRQSLEELGKPSKVAGIIQESNIPNWQQDQRRKLHDALNQESEKFHRQWMREVTEHGTMGVMSDLGVAMHVKPKKGVLYTINGVHYVFKENNIPSKSKVERWEEMQKRSEQLSEEAVEYNWYGGWSPNTVTGNYKVVEHGRRLRSKGLLSEEEDKNLKNLERFWELHPTLDRVHGYGIYKEDGSIMAAEKYLKIDTHKVKIEREAPEQRSRREALEEYARLRRDESTGFRGDSITVEAFKRRRLRELSQIIKS